MLTFRAAVRRPGCSSDTNDNTRDHQNTLSSHQTTHSFRMVRDTGRCFPAGLRESRRSSYALYPHGTDDDYKNPDVAHKVFSLRFEQRDHY